MECSVAIVQ